MKTNLLYSSVLSLDINLYLSDPEIVVFGDEKNNLRLYSSWPPILPPFRSDSYMKPDLLDHSKLHNILSLMEIHWMSNRESDISSLSQMNVELSSIVSKTQSISEIVNDITSEKEIDYKEFLDQVSNLKTTLNSKNLFKDFYNNSIDLIDEVGKVINCLDKNDATMLKKVLDNCNILFRGTSGLGLNQYIGYKFSK